MIQDLLVAPVGGQPRLHRPEPVVRALRRRRPARLPPLRPRSRAGRRLRAGAGGRARSLREALDALGHADAIAKTTGSRGIHVYVPIVRGPDAEAGVDVRQGARPGPRAARIRSSSPPSTAIAKRPAGRVLVDYNQNAWGRTLASVYSVRPRPARRCRRRSPGRRSSAASRIEDFRIDNVPARARASWAISARRCSPARGAASGCERVRMTLPLRPPYPPDGGAARSTRSRAGHGWQYEPKWDGFRCLAFRDGDDGRAPAPRRASRSARYFPEVVDGGRAPLPAPPLRPRRRARGAGGRRARRSTSCSSAFIPPTSRVQQARRARRPRVLIVFDLLVDDDGPLARRPPARRAPPRGSRRSRRDVPAAARARSPLARHHRRRRRRSAWLVARGRQSGRRHRQAPRPAVPVRRPRRHAEDQARPHGRLRRRRVPLRLGRARGRLAPARALRRRRAPASRRASRPDSRRRSGRRCSQSFGRSRAAPGFTGRAPAARAAGPPSVRASGSRCAAPRRRGDVRPLHRRALPPRHALPALAPGQGPAPVHDGPDRIGRAAAAGRAAGRRA